MDLDSELLLKEEAEEELIISDIEDDSKDFISFISDIMDLEDMDLDMDSESIEERSEELIIDSLEDILLDSEAEELLILLIIEFAESERSIDLPMESESKDIGSPPPESIGGIAPPDEKDSDDDMDLDSEDIIDLELDEKPSPSSCDSCCISLASESILCSVSVLEPSSASVTIFISLASVIWLILFVANPVSVSFASETIFKSFAS